jgi:hypothetical protein
MRFRNKVNGSGGKPLRKQAQHYNYVAPGPHLRQTPTTGANSAAHLAELQQLYSSQAQQRRAALAISNRRGSGVTGKLFTQQRVSHKNPGVRLNRRRIP